ncbi:MAG: RNB domain-containing ribonuclease [Nocardioidaceae bacterium]
MPLPVIRILHPDGDMLRHGVTVIEKQLGLTAEFPEDVQQVAQQAAGQPRLPRLDRSDLPLVTIDPTGARDLDQALHIARDGDGFVVHYAIADVAAFVTPGDPVDQEAHRRGETYYGALSKVPLHPPLLSEGAASLLPDALRPALLWRIAVDAEGETSHVHVERALVRSRAQWDYQAVQDALEAGTADEVFVLLAAVGRLRLAREAARGGVSLPLPEQEVERSGDRWQLRFRTPLPVEEWNAQISLLTGMAAGTLMVEAGVGLLRTLPPPEDRDVERLRRTARGLGIGWPDGVDYPEFVRSLDPARPTHAAMLVSCTRLLRGAGYVAFDGAPPDQHGHAAIAAAYAHVTAPLRRLADRYAGEVCLALCAGEEVPGWVRSALGSLPATMSASGQRAGRYEGAVHDLVEAAVLAPRVGESFPAVVVAVEEARPNRGKLVVQDPAVEASVRSAGPLPLGGRVQARLVEADVRARRVRFEV